jgi:hypothetical protein
MPEPIRIEATDAPKDDVIEREATMAEVRRAPVDGPDRIADAFARAREENRAALVIYLSAGYPDPDTSLACFHAAAEAGADLLEVGIPFSDPMMDGPVIQQANQHVLDSGQGVTDHLALCTLLTAEVDVPALAMTYVTIADARGYDAFAEACAAAGLAGSSCPTCRRGRATTGGWPPPGTTWQPCSSPPACPPTSAWTPSPTCRPGSCTRRDCWA